MGAKSNMVKNSGKAQHFNIASKQKKGRGDEPPALSGHIV
jgi:hypothetical protein